MTYRGHMKDGVIVLDEPADLPEGTEVRVEPVKQEMPPSWEETFRDVAGRAEGLPEDIAHNHDHYLHGTPKR